MRTRIALVAIIPVALITVSTLTQSATAQSVRSVPNRPRGAAPTVHMPPNMTVAYRNLASGAPAAAVELSLPFDRTAAQLVPHIVTTKGALTPDTAAIRALAATPQPAKASPTPQPAAAPSVPAPGPVDTVTPDQRAAWERVAMCEEGGDWGFEGSSFSGGLGISRANWDAYGGTEFAPEGSEATEDEQIMVAERIQSYAPDQDGCSGW